MLTKKDLQQIKFLFQENNAELEERLEKRFEGKFATKEDLHSLELRLTEKLTREIQQTKDELYYAIKNIQDDISIAVGYSSRIDDCEKRLDILEVRDKRETRIS